MTIDLFMRVPATRNIFVDRAQQTNHIFTIDLDRRVYFSFSEFDVIFLDGYAGIAGFHVCDVERIEQHRILSDFRSAGVGVVIYS